MPWETCGVGSDSTLQHWAAARADELPGSSLGHPFGPDADVYKVRGKVFMLMMTVKGVPLVTLKAQPFDGEALREAFDEVAPGYHMNKRHWISLRAGGRLPRDLVEDLVTDSYCLVVATLPRSLRPIDPATFGTG